jgi:hypothetical protein
MRFLRCTRSPRCKLLTQHSLPLLISQQVEENQGEKDVSKDELGFSDFGYADYDADEFCFVI